MALTAIAGETVATLVRSGAARLVRSATRKARATSASQAAVAGIATAARIARTTAKITRIRSIAVAVSPRAGSAVRAAGFAGDSARRARRPVAFVLDSIAADGAFILRGVNTLTSRRARPNRASLGGVDAIQATVTTANTTMSRVGRSRALGRGSNRVAKVAAVKARRAAHPGKTGSRHSADHAAVARISASTRILRGAAASTTTPARSTTTSSTVALLWHAQVLALSHVRAHRRVSHIAEIRDGGSADALREAGPSDIAGLATSAARGPNASHRTTRNAKGRVRHIGAHHEQIGIRGRTTADQRQQHHHARQHRPSSTTRLSPYKPCVRLHHRNRHLVLYGCQGRRLQRNVQ